MKFFYNGKLIRKSKTHEYKYALLTPSDNLVMCSASYDGCMKRWNREIAYRAGWKEYYEGIISTVEGGGSHKDPISGLFTVDRIEELKRYYRHSVEHCEYVSNYKIVELERKE